MPSINGFITVLFFTQVKLCSHKENVQVTLYVRVGEAMLKGPNYQGILIWYWCDIAWM